MNKVHQQVELASVAKNAFELNTASARTLIHAVVLLGIDGKPYDANQENAKYVIHPNGATSKYSVEATEQASTEPVYHVSFDVSDGNSVNQSFARGVQAALFQKRAEELPSLRCQRIRTLANIPLNMFLWQEADPSDESLSTLREVSIVTPGTSLNQEFLQSAQATVTSSPHLRNLAPVVTALN